MKIVVRLRVPQDVFGDLEQAPQLDQRRVAGARRRLECRLSRKAKAQDAQAGLVGHPEQVVRLGQGADAAAVTLRLPALGALDQPAAPGFGRRVSDRAEDRSAAGRGERAPGDPEAGLEGERAGPGQPGRVVPEGGRRSWERR